MGGSLQRTQRHLDTNTGKSVIDNKVPTLILAAERDGLHRVTRNAEAFYHHVKNINKDQAGQYPVQVMRGHNHASFMDGKFSIDRVV